MSGLRMQRGKVKIIIGIIAAVLLLGWGGLYVAAHYPQWRAEQQVRRTADELKRIEEDDYQRAMADTYGGKTPQETLSLFIQAVEAGDYELASKYFIGDKQGEWKENLGALTNTDDFLEVLRGVNFENGEFSVNQDKYLIHDPILITFRLYPNGIWKIIEI